MTETTASVPAAEPKPAPDPVEICGQAYDRAYKTTRKHSETILYAAQQAEMAYRKAMPQLSGPENIRDFIACVAYGMLIKAIPGAEGARLLYAA